MGAANRGSDDIIEFLVSKGAKLDAKDKEGRTPLDWAEGVFLATHPAKPKPSSIALHQEAVEPPPQPDSMNPFGRSVRRSSASCRALSSLSARQPDARQSPEPSAAAGAARISIASTCHNQRLKTAGLLLDSMDLEHVGQDAAAWEKVVRKIRTGHDAAQAARAVLSAPCSTASRRISRRRLDKAVVAGTTSTRRRCIASIAPSTRTRFATCSRSTSTPRRCCRPTHRATDSTTSRTRSACRRR